MASKFKCSIEQYSTLQRFRDNLILLKVELERAENLRRYYLEAGNIELASIATNKINELTKEIRATEREIEKLESVCFVST